MSKIGVKFVQGGKVYSVDFAEECNVGDKIVVETIRGLEIGEVCKETDGALGEEIKKAIRIASQEDIKKAEELSKNEKKVIDITKGLIGKYKLDMKLVNATFTLDGSKVIINYVCEDRVDFRELVKDLASQLKMRIELRQIGIRDQAKIIGGIGFCGKECCCKTYLNDFDKVSIKMAKSQGLSLNPVKISGICGRLMCCLAYENEFYSEISTKMPKLNARVKTNDGIGSVIYNNLLKQKVTVKMESDNEVKIGEYSVEEIEVLPKLNTNENKPKEVKKENVEKPKEAEVKPEIKENKKDDKPQNKKFNKFNKKKNYHGNKNK